MLEVLGGLLLGLLIRALPGGSPAFGFAVGAACGSPVIAATSYLIGITGGAGGHFVQPNSPLSLRIIALILGALFPLHVQLGLPLLVLAYGLWRFGLNLKSFLGIAFACLVTLCLSREFFFLSAGLITFMGLLQQRRSHFSLPLPGICTAAAHTFPYIDAIEVYLETSSLISGSHSGIALVYCSGTPYLGFILAATVLASLIPLPVKTNRKITLTLNTLAVAALSGIVGLLLLGVAFFSADGISFYFLGLW